MDNTTTLVGYITDDYSVIVDVYDGDEDLVRWIRGHYVRGYVLNVQNATVNQILDAWKNHVGDMLDKTTGRR